MTSEKRPGNASVTKTQYLPWSHLRAIWQKHPTIVAARKNWTLFAVCMKCKDIGSAGYVRASADWCQSCCRKTSKQGPGNHYCSSCEESYSRHYSNIDGEQKYMLRLLDPLIAFFEPDYLIDFTGEKRIQGQVSRDNERESRIGIFDVYLSFEKRSVSNVYVGIENIISADVTSSSFEAKRDFLLRQCGTSCDKAFLILNYEARSLSQMIVLRAWIQAILVHEMTDGKKKFKPKTLIVISVNAHPTSFATTRKNTVATTNVSHEIHISLKSTELPKDRDHEYLFFLHYNGVEKLKKADGGAFIDRLTGTVFEQALL